MHLWLYVHFLFGTCSTVCARIFPFSDTGTFIQILMLSNLAFWYKKEHNSTILVAGNYDRGQPTRNI